MKFAKSQLKQIIVEVKQAQLPDVAPGPRYVWDEKTSAFRDQKGREAPIKQSEGGLDRVWKMVINEIELYLYGPWGPKSRGVEHAKLFDIWTKNSEGSKLIRNFLQKNQVGDERQLNSILTKVLQNWTRFRDAKKGVSPEDRQSEWAGVEELTQNILKNAIFKAAVDQRLATVRGKSRSAVSPHHPMKESKIMKITKSQLKQLIKEEIESTLNEVNPAAQAIRDDIAAHQGVESKSARSGQEVADELGHSDEPGDGVPEEIVLMETLWDVVRGFYKLGRSDVALKLQKIAEMADEGHERLLPPGEGAPGFSLPEAPPIGSQEHQRRRSYRNP